MNGLLSWEDGGTKTGHKEGGATVKASMTDSLLKRNRLGQEKEKKIVLKHADEAQ